MNYEQIETCPWCEHENEYPNWDVDKKGFIATCEKCGEKIFLCDACMHHEDNPDMKCDWRKEDAGSRCFRGFIEKRIYDIRSSEVFTDIKGLMASFPGCTVDGDYLWYVVGQGYDTEESECEVDSFDEAEKALDNNPLYYNEIDIRDESSITITEYHLSIIWRDEYGELDDVSFYWLYQSGKTSVWYGVSQHEDFDTFEEAKEYALKLLNVTVGKE